MKNIFFIIINFYSILIFGQSNKAKDLDSIAQNFIVQLKLEKIDTIAVYETYATGGAHIIYVKKGEEIERCQYSVVPKTIYFLWKQNNKTFCAKKDDCFDYASIQVQDQSLWKTFYDNVEIIKLEKTKHFQTEEDGFMMIDHSSYRDFNFVIKDQFIKQRFDSYDFLEKEEYTEYPKKNLNYQFNQNLKSKIVMDILENISKKYDSKVVLEQKKKRI